MYLKENAFIIPLKISFIFSNTHLGDGVMQAKNNSGKLSDQMPVIMVLGFFSLLTSISGSSTNLALPNISEDLRISNGQST